jgi:hypothetical protein
MFPVPSCICSLLHPPLHDVLFGTRPPSQDYRWACDSFSTCDSRCKLLSSFLSLDTPSLLWPASCACPLVRPVTPLTHARFRGGCSHVQFCTTTSPATGSPCSARYSSHSLNLFNTARGPCAEIIFFSATTANARADRCGTVDAYIASALPRKRATSCALRFLHTAITKAGFADHAAQAQLFCAQGTTQSSYFGIYASDSI